MTTSPKKYRQIYQCTGGFDDIKCSGAISFPYVDSQLVPKYLKESETDKILFLNIFYLKQLISKKMGAEVSNFLRACARVQCI